MQRRLQVSRKRRRERDEADRQRRNSIINFMCRKSNLLHCQIAMICAIMLSEFEWLTKIPPPLVPDWRFHPSQCGTLRTQGLQAEHLFRFSQENLWILLDALKMPHIMRTPERDAFYGIEGLCIVLRRLVFPVRYMDMVVLNIWKADVSVISYISSHDGVAICQMVTPGEFRCCQGK